jgi:hypothetical protein
MSLIRKSRLCGGFNLTVALMQRKSEDDMSAPCYLGAGFPLSFSTIRIALILKLPYSPDFPNGQREVQTRPINSLLCCPYLPPNMQAHGKHGPASQPKIPAFPL